MTINPIVAPVGSRPGDPWAGIGLAWLAEDVEAIHQGVTSGSWIDWTLGGVGAGLDTLAAVSDPLGTLMQYGLSWLMEHIRPLSEALDWLAGDPAQIAAHSQTWRNVAASLRSDVATFGHGAGTGVSGWQGTAATAYETWASHQQTALGGLASAADSMASISDGAAYLIAGVRIMVRDAIATVVSRAIDYAGEEFFSFGLATPWVIEQVSTLVASWSARIGRWMTALGDSVGRLTSMMSRLGEIIEALKKLLRDEHTTGGGDPISPKGHDPAPRSNSAPKPGDDWLSGARSKLPPEWGDGSANRKGVGTRWQDPNDPGSGVRIDQGNPANPQVTQQGDHVVVRYDGKVIGRDGRPLTGSVASDPTMSHIPLSEWLTWSTWYSP